MVKITREMWIEAFAGSLGLAVEQIDKPRIIAAFKEARKTMRKWPAPVAVIELMPRRPEAKRINYDPPADAETAKNAFAICQDVIDGKISTEEANALLAEHRNPEEEGDVPY